jgi:hypothetical protein
MPQNRPNGSRQSAAGQRLRGKSNAANKAGSLRARKTAAAKKAGFESTAAQHSVVAQYGLVKNEQGKWVKPDAAFLERQMAANGWGVGQTGVTPVAIGGARWLTGAGALTFTGERSDSAKRNPGAAYGASGQKKYTGKPKGKGRGKGGGKGNGHGGGQGGGGGGAGGGGGGGQGSPGAAVPPNASTAPGSAGGFTTGVSGATGQFVTEAGGAGPAGEEAETTKQTHRKRKKNKKLVKRVVKKTDVKGKAVRRALRSPGITAHDKKVYKRVAKTAPKLSARLRQRDRKK